MYYQPSRALGLLVGTVLALWTAAVGFVLFDNGLNSPIGIEGLISYVVAAAAAGLTALFAYWTYSLATLSYALDRNGLVISWGATRQVIPLGAIERLVPGTSIGVPRVAGVSWWGHHVGRARIERIGEVLFYSTHQSPAQVLYVMTSERNYAISVDDPADFAQQIQIRQDLGPTGTVTHHVERSGSALQGFWDDGVAVALALLALLAGAGVWAQVALGYGDLPSTLELHFPPSEVIPIVTVVSRDAILELPRVASLVLVLNVVLGVLIHGWERVAGYVLFLAAIAVQLALIAAYAIATA
ncbi:MAG: PH domain-containing protein [Dehalococcoidia bacterium]